MRRLTSIMDVVEQRLCLGCGACAYICPEANVRLFDFAEEGIRPVLRHHSCADCNQCLAVCPAVQIDFRVTGASGETMAGFTEKWGPVLALWEGFATDPEIRFKGSSGGALTALGAYCIEQLGMHGVLHIAQDPDDPIHNHTKLSRSREELVQATGSRYSPASVCNGLGLVEQASSPCAIIGKPAEIAAVENARKMRPDLDARIGVTMSFFCAETPATRGTMDLLERMGMNVESLHDLRYRGLGWPGFFAPVRRGESELRSKMTYRESWAFLQAYRPWSVQLWPDGTGELADISCGDPWYKEPDGCNPGFSLVLARTESGRSIVEGAIKAGYLKLTLAEPWKLEKSQAGLLTKKGAVWGRLLALRLFGLPAPTFTGSALFSCWRRLPFVDKVKSIFGTIKRIITRRLFRPLRLDPDKGVPVRSPVREES